MIGHNATPADAELARLVERIERLAEQRAEIASDIAAVYAEAKGNGFDTKALKLVIARRRDAEKTRATDEIVDVYEQAIARASTRT